MTPPRCTLCWEPYPTGNPCPGCGEPVTALNIGTSIEADGTSRCEHRLLAVTFDAIGDGRYRVVMPGDASTIHECMTAAELEELARLEASRPNWDTD